MDLETKRLTLRPWCEEDAPELFKYASDPQIGPAAGWPVHMSVADSRGVIINVLSEPETYAVVLKETGKPVGSISIKLDSDITGKASNEGEIGYWIGVPYWGQGLIPEAVRELQRRSFRDLELDGLWCGYFDGNEKSRRAQEKCGFSYHHTEYDKPWPLLNTTVTEHFTYLGREAWEKLQ